MPNSNIQPSPTKTSRLQNLNPIMRHNVQLKREPQQENEQTGRSTKKAIIAGLTTAVVGAVAYLTYRFYAMNHQFVLNHLKTTQKGIEESTVASEEALFSTEPSSQVLAVADNSFRNGIYKFLSRYPFLFRLTADTTVYDVGAEVYGVDVKGTCAYIAAGDAGVVILDVSNPDTPQFIGDISTIDYVQDIEVIDNIAYVGKFRSNGGLYIFNVTTPSAPSLIGQYTSSYVTAIKVVDDKVFTLGNNELTIIDVSNPAVPMLQGQLSDTAFSGGWGIAVDINKTLAFVTRDGGYVESLQIIDISNPASPTLVGSYIGLTYGGYGIVVDESVAYVVHLDGLQIIDVSSSVNPKHLATYSVISTRRPIFFATKLPDAFAYDCNIAKINNKIYFPIDEVMHVIDVTDPKKPWMDSIIFFQEPVAQSSVRSPSFDITIVNNIAYIAKSTDGLVILNLNKLNLTIAWENIANGVLWMGLTIAGAVIVTSPCTVGSYAIQKYRHRHETKTFKATRKKAKKGDKEAQYELSLMYEEGDDVKQDGMKALTWYKKSELDDKAQSSFHVKQSTSIVKSDEGNSNNTATAVIPLKEPDTTEPADATNQKPVLSLEDQLTAIKKTYEQKKYIVVKSKLLSVLDTLKQEVSANPLEHFNVLIMLGVASGKLGETQKGIEYLEEALSDSPDAHSNISEANVELGLLYVQEKNYSNAKERFEKAKQTLEGLPDKAKNSTLESEVAKNILLCQEHLAKQHFKSINAAAKKGDVSAHYQLVQMYDEGLGVKEDKQKARQCLEKAADGGNVNAQFQLAAKLGAESLQGIPAEESAAVVDDSKITITPEQHRYYKMAALQGHSESQYTLGYCHELGEGGVTQNESSASEWYQKAAAQGEPLAIQRLINLYVQEKVSPQYTAEETSWYESQAKDGGANVQCQLAKRYAEGKGAEKNLTQAFYWYKEAAEQGDHKAQNQVGVMYENGEGVEKDLAQAEKWYELAAEEDQSEAQLHLLDQYTASPDHWRQDESAIKLYEKLAIQGNAKAQHYFGLANRDGLFVSQDAQAAVKWLKSSAKQAFLLAQDALVQLYVSAKADAEYDKETLSWYERVAEQGDRNAQTLLGQYFEKSDSSSNKNIEQAIKWYTKAAYLEHVDAQFKMAQFTHAGIACDKSVVKAVMWYKKAAEQGHVDAQYELAQCYEAGEGTEQNDALAAKCYEQSAEQGSALAQVKIAMCYAIGKGVVKDDAQAAKWYEKSALQGSVESQYKIGGCYELGRGVEQDYQKAIKYYGQAVSKNYAPAQVALGLMYEKGQGVNQSDEQAVEYYEKADSQKNAAAAYHLGAAYQAGRGVEQDDKTAVKWYQKAAKQHYAPALSALGLLYEEGRGVPQSQKEAIKYYKEATKKNDENGQYCLGAMYDAGKGVPQSDEQAAKWYALSAAQGHEEAKERLEIVQAKIQRTQSLTTSQSPRVGTPTSSRSRHGTVSDEAIQEYLLPYDALLFSSDDVLGEGGFGVVYKGTYQNAEVAIKQLKMSHLSDDDLTDFTQEAAVMAKLRHPNIIQLFGVSVDVPGKYSMVMEYMPKGSLYDLLRSEQPLEWQVRYRIAIDVSAGLTHLHEQNILHRDLKSPNVLLGDNNRAKLTDFGLAKMKSANQITQTAAGEKAQGTVAWMAPELFKRRSKFTNKADIYSLGVLFWEIAARKVPFADASTQEVLVEWVKDGETEDIPEDTPPAFGALIKSCWQKNPDERPDINQVAQRLTKLFQAGQRVAKTAEATGGQDSEYQSNMETMAL